MNYETQFTLTGNLKEFQDLRYAIDRYRSILHASKYEFTDENVRAKFEERIDEVNALHAKVDDIIHKKLLEPFNFLHGVTSEDLPF